MAQVDRIIIRFEIQGGKQAQLVLSNLSKLLVGINPAAMKGKQGITAFAQATGTGAMAVNKFGASIDNTVLKISEFAVVIFALVGAYNALVKPTVEINKNMKIVESVSHATTLELATLKEEAIRLGTIFPGGAAKATAALVAIGQAGYNTRESMQLMEPVFKLATIGAVDYADSVELMIAVLNAFNKPVEQASQVVDTLSASISHTLTTFDTFKVALPALSSLAEDLGIEFEEVVVLLGHLRDRGIPASRTATALKNVFTELTKETMKTSKALEGTGLNVKDFDIQARGLRPVLESVIRANLSVGQTLDLLGLRGIYASSILKEDLIASLWDLTEQLKESGESSFQTGIILEATASKWGQLAGEINRSLEETWAPYLEVVDKIIEGLKHFVRALRTIPAPIQALIRFVTSLFLGLTALSLIVKANILLFKNFIWQQGIAAAIPVVAAFIEKIRLLTVINLAYRSGLMASTAATAGFLAVSGPLIATLGGVAIAVGLVVGGLALYKKSLRGIEDATQDSARELKTQVEDLKGLRDRLKGAQKEFVELKKKGKDTVAPLVEIRTVMIDIVEKFPQLRQEIGAFDTMEDKIGAVNTKLGTMNRELREVVDRLEEIASQKFFNTLLEIAGETSLFDKATEGSVIAKPGRDGARITLPKPEGVIREFFGDLLGGEGLAASDNMIYLRMTGTLTSNILGNLDDAIEKRPMSGEDRAAAEKISNMLWIRLWNEQNAAAGDTGGATPPGGAGGSKTSFKVPGLQEFRDMLRLQREINDLGEAEYELKRRQEGATELQIEASLLDLKRINYNNELKTIASYKDFLTLYSKVVTKEEDRAKVVKEINKLESENMRIAIGLIGLDLKRFDILDKIIKQIFKYKDEKRKEKEAAQKEFDRAEESLGSLAEVMDELQREYVIGDITDMNKLEIAESQLKILERHLSRIMDFIDDIEENFAGIGEEAMENLRLQGEELLRAIEPIATGLRDDVSLLKKTKVAEGIYDDTRDAVESALVDALTSGNIKEAITAFADLIKNAVAEKFAKQIADSIPDLIGGLSNLAGGAGSTNALLTRRQTANAARPAGDQGQGSMSGLAGAGAGIEAGGMAGVLGWLGVGLMAVSFLDSMFGGDKIQQLDTKLDYILRGGGYQLPPSFLLPEDQGEFSMRRRGDDAFMVRFPQRNLSMNITHKFVWQPAELAKAVGSDMSVGGMSGAKQYSLIGGE